MNFVRGMNRLALLIGVIAAAVAFLVFFPNAQAGYLWGAFLASGLVGAVAWGIVRAITWVTRGFKSN
jgi:hypothetical protein